MDKSLSDDAGGTEDSYWDFARHSLLDTKEMNEILQHADGLSSDSDADPQITAAQERLIPGPRAQAEPRFPPAPPHRVFAGEAWLELWLSWFSAVGEW